MKRRVIREAISQDQINTYKSMFDSMELNEKTGWWKAIKECIQELGYGSITRSDIAVTTAGVGLIIMGVKLKIPFLCVMGAASLGAIAHFEKDVWVKIIQCANNKRKETDTIPDEKITETKKMKKVIKLTESDLRRIVRRVIKEDDIALSAAFKPKLTIKDILNEFDDVNDGMMIEVKNNKLTITFPDNAQYIIDLGPKKVNDISSQQSRIFKRNGKLLVKPVSGGSVVIEPFFSVVKKGF